MKFVNSLKTKIATITFLCMASAGAFAEGGTAPANNNIDYSQLTNSLNFGNVMVGILAVAGALIGIYAGVAGVRWVLRMVRSA